MTDNEKRAHDLAVASIPFIVEQVKTKSSSFEEISFSLDETYFRLYQLLLTEMNKRFPVPEK